MQHFFQYGLNLILTRCRLGKRWTNISQQDKTWTEYLSLNLIIRYLLNCYKNQFQLPLD